jgi:ferredoxin
MALRIELNKDKCQAYHRCTVVAPAVFALDGDDKVELADPRGASDEIVLKAAKACPYRVIALFDEATGEQLFPIARK